LKKIVIIFISFLIIQTASSQEPVGINVKSNLSNLLAKKPSFSIEKTFRQRYGLELSYSSGELNWGRDYKFSGFLLRGKMYAYKIKSKEITPFWGLYAGNLDKTIISNAEVDNTGFISIGRNRNFEANSVRSGVNVGFIYLPFKRLILETTTGLGYGKYFNIKNNLHQAAPKGYLDFQLWLSVGYTF
jgi:hypothetical protein